jgi:hypothetical protein
MPISNLGWDVGHPDLGTSNSYPCVSLLRHHAMKMHMELELSVLTGYVLEGRGSVLRIGMTVFSLPQRADRVWRSPSISYNVALSLRVKRPGLEADYFHLVPRSRMVELS